MDDRLAIATESPFWRSSVACRSIALPPCRNEEAVEDPELWRSFLFRLKEGRSVGRLNKSASSPDALLSSSVDDPVAEDPPEIFRSYMNRIAK